jgi:hypothetical protein
MKMYEIVATAGEGVMLLHTIGDEGQVFNLLSGMDEDVTVTIVRAPDGEPGDFH